jgi:hypothetical protein
VASINNAGNGGTYATNSPTSYVLTEDDFRPVGFYQNGTIKFQFSVDSEGFYLENETVTGPSYRVPNRNRNGGTRRAGGRSASASTVRQNGVRIFITVYVPGTQTVAFTKKVDARALHEVSPAPQLINVPAG